MNPQLSRYYHWFMGFVSFFQEVYKNPREMGTGFPSSIYLAKNIVKYVKHQDGLIVELGPGTGGFTKMLLKAGFNPKKFMSLNCLNPWQKICKRDFQTYTLFMRRKAFKRVDSN